MSGSRPHVVQVVCSNVFAGVERYVVSLSRGLVERGCAVTVLGGESDRMRAELVGSGVDHRPAPRIRDAVRALSALRGVDLVHTHMTDAELASALAWPLVRKPTVTTRHFAAQRGSSAPARALRPMLRRVVPTQLAISTFVQDRIDGDALVIRPGVPDRPNIADEQRADVVLLAQRLEQEKRTELALRIWALAGLQQVGWRLQLAGSGQQKSRLERLAVALDIADSCEFLGPRRDVPELLARASIFLATCPDEPFGLSVVEAMAAGLPVLAAAGGGHEETVGRAPDAQMFDISDITGAARALSRLADGPDLRHRYGAALRDVQRTEFTVARQIEQTLEAYRRLW